MLRCREIWDNFAVEYEYPGGARMCSNCGQMKRAWSSVSEAVRGTKGTSNPGGGYRTFDRQSWRSSLELESGNPYVRQHIALVNAILNKFDQAQDLGTARAKVRAVFYS